MNTKAESRKQKAETLVPAAPWVRYPWDPKEPVCVRCGHAMCLNEGCEWHDCADLNLCHSCALDVLRENWKRSEPLEYEIVKCRSGDGSFDVWTPNATGAILGSGETHAEAARDAIRNLAQTISALRGDVA